MAPLGEWSLEATFLDGARGTSDTVGLVNGAQRRDIPRQSPARRRPPEPGGERTAD
jgi:hypothetical protein